MTVLNRIIIFGKKLVCPICEHDLFMERSFMLNTQSATFFGWDWADATAINYICNHCGHVLWFAKNIGQHEEVKKPYSEEQKRMFPNTKCPICSKPNKECTC